MECMDDLEERGEEILSGKQTQKRGRSPQFVNGQVKNKTKEGPVLMAQLKVEKGKFALSDLQDSANVVL